MEIKPQPISPKAKAAIIQALASKPVSKFPDYTQNYLATVEAPRLAALQAAQEAEIQAQANAQLEAQNAATASQNGQISYSPSASGDIQSTIIHWAAIYGVDGSLLLRIAKCESGFNPYAHNASGATGLFQFMPSTFYSNGGKNIYDVADQASTAAKMFSEGQAHQWVCS